MEMITIGPSEAKLTAFKGELQRAAASMKSKVKLAVVYMPIELPHENFLRMISNTLEVPAVGASHGGVTFTERGYQRNAIACALLGGDDLDVSVAVARNIRGSQAESLKEACDKILAAHRATKGKPSLSVMVFADPFACDGEVLLQSLRTHLPAHARCFGGNAADDWTFTGTKVFIGNEAISDAVVLASLATTARVQMAAQHGWCAFDQGRDLTITKAQGNIVRTLDDKPAFEVYRDELRRLGLLREGESAVSLMAKYELGAKTPFANELKIRTPLAVNEADGSITLTASLPVGTIVRVVHGSSEQLVQAAADLRNKVSAAVASPMRGMFVIDCAGRVALLQEKFTQEYEALLGDGKCPMLGTSAYGEIAKWGGSMEGFHNTTAVIAAW